eukprot:746213-Hanusia_phi.AAC.2
MTRPDRDSCPNSSSVSIKLWEEEERGGEEEGEEEVKQSFAWACCMQKSETTAKAEASRMWVSAERKERNSKVRRGSDWESFQLDKSFLYTLRHPLPS